MRFSILCLLLFYLPLTAQRPAHRFEKGHPLTNGYITDLLESREGMLYVASQAGLRRFDGENVRTINGRYGSLGGSPHTLLETRDGDIWIGHHRGLTKFSPGRESLYDYGAPNEDIRDNPTKTTLFRMVENLAGTTLWGLTDVGLVNFDRNGETWLPTTPLRHRQDSLATGHCQDIVRTADGNFLLACEGGIFRLTETTGQLFPAYTDSLNALGAFRLLLTATGELLVGGREIIYYFERTTGGKLRMAGQLDLAPGTTGERTLCKDCVETTPGEFYVATNRGVHAFSWLPDRPFNDSLRIRRFNYDPDQEESLSSDLVNALAPGSGGLLWAGTRKGVTRLPTGPSPFTNFHRKPGVIELCNDYVKGTAVDAGHELLVLGTTTGLSLYHYPSGNWRCYTPDNLPGLRSAYLINVDPGPTPHTFWVLYRKGGADLLDLTDPDAPVVRPGIHPAGATDVTHAYEVAYRSDGTCYVATGRGLFVYNPARDTGEWLQHDPADSTSLPDNYCYAVYVDRADRVWVGTRNAGLCRLYERPAGPAFESWRRVADDPTSLVSNLVLNIFEEANGHLWISTPGGISLWEGEGNFRSFGTDEGLPHPLSYGIFADVSGQLWTVQAGQITRVGLNTEGKFTVGAGYRQRDGMAGDNCTQYGWTNLPDGRIAISHPDGLSLFHPDSLLESNYLPPVLITEVQLFSQPVTVAGSPADTIPGRTSLPTAPQRLQTLHLPPGQNFLGFSFAIPEYRPYRQARYGWRMPGIQDGWVDTEGRNYLAFPGLPPGDYELELRSGDRYGTWSDDVRTLSIHLAAPWYQRWWSRVLFGLLLVALVLGFARLTERQRRRVETARRQEREEFRRRSARDFHDEAGNHLTRASLLTAVARQHHDKPAELTGYLDDIDANLQVLREGMRDFIWALDPGHDNAHELGLRLKRFGQELFEHHAAKFSGGELAPDLLEVNLRADQRRHLLLICKEAMHNSMKHAENATEVQLELKLVNGNLLLRWTDNGRGLDPQTTGGGHGLANMRGRAEKIGAQLKMSGKAGCRIEVELSV